MKILVLHGPNLNLLGEREPEIYGHETLGDINLKLEQQARDRGHHLLYMQSNAEYELIERVQDPLLHILRNSIDHGLETPEQRQAAGDLWAGYHLSQTGVRAVD